MIKNKCKIISMVFKFHMKIWNFVNVMADSNRGNGPLYGLKWTTEKPWRQPYVLALLRAATFALTQTLGLFLSFQGKAARHIVGLVVESIFLVGWANKGMISSFLLVQLSCYLKG